MSNFWSWVRKWWPGLIPLAMLWAAAVWNTTLPVEGDIGGRAVAAIKDTVLDKTRIEVAGRDVRFVADAFSEQGRRSAVSQVEAVTGGAALSTGADVRVVSVVAPDVVEVAPITAGR